MKRLCILYVAVLSFTRPASAASLYDQTMAATLEKGFPSPSISYLLLEPTAGTIVSARWEDAGEAIPIGSLVKPFAALAYAECHDFRYPEFVCKGTTSGCWFPRGHGHIGIAQALAFSCNAYFRMLAAVLRPEDVSAVMARYGIHSHADGLASGSLIGLGGEWKLLPQEIARAYCRLANDSMTPGVAELFQGMVLAARIGTAIQVGRAFPHVETLAKTGTAPCVHRHRGPGDGYVILLYPAEFPRITLFVRVHGVPGYQAAALGGQMLRAAVECR